MKQRFITAAIGIPILFLFLFGHPLLTDGFIAIAALIAAYEYLQLTERDSPPEQILFIFGLIGILALPLLLPAETLFLLFAGLILLSLGLYNLHLLPLWFHGTLYLGIPLASAISLRVMDQGLKWMLIFLLTTWITDSMAYFGGKAFGKRKLTAISPNKTQEGTLIGVVSGFFSMIALGFVFGLLDPYPQTIILAALILPPLAVIGDLVESKIKRNYGKKDSGNFFPGHGGMLDRVDSLLLTCPALWVLVVLSF